MNDQEVTDGGPTMATPPTRGYRPPVKEPPASEWPREYGEFSLPIGPYHMGSIYMPVVMTNEEWDTVFNYLEIVRRGAKGV